MTNQFTKAFIGSIVILFSLYGIKNFDSTFNTLGLKIFHAIKSYSSNLESSKTMEYTCKKMDDDFLNFYKEPKNHYYTFEPEQEGDEVMDKLMEKIFSDSSNNTDDDVNNLVTEYLDKYNIFIKSVIFLVFIILIFIPCVICYCGKCFCCMCNFLNHGAKIYLIIAAIISTTVTILVIVGLALNGRILRGVYGIGCSSIKIVDHLLRGDEYNTPPYWIGLYKTAEKFESISLNLKKIKEESSNNQQLYENIKKDKSNFENGIIEDLEDILNKTVHSPDPFKPEEFLNPDDILVSKYYNTSVSTIKKNFQNILNFDAIEEINSNLKITDEQLKNIPEGLTNGLSNLTSHLTEIQNYIDGPITQYQSQIDKADSIVRTIMNLVFALEILLSASLLGCLFFIFFKGKGKTIISILWFIMYLFMIISIILGIIFGVSGNLIKDVIFATSRLFKKISKSDFGFLTDGAEKLLDKCVNHQGKEINPVIFEDTTILDLIVYFYSVPQNVFDLVDKDIKKDIEFIKKEKFYYEGKSKEIELDYESLKTTLDEVRKYIDKSFKENYISQDSPEINDIWVKNKENCPKGYEYLAPSEADNINENKKCIQITEWDEQKLNERYSNIKINPEIDPPYPDISSAISSYYTQINLFCTEIDEIYSHIISRMDDYINEYNQAYSDIVLFGNDVKHDVEPITSIFNTLIGDKESILNVFNCGFIRRDFNYVIYAIYERFGGSLTTISNILIAISFLEGALTLFLLMTIVSYKRNEKENQSNSSEQIENEMESVSKLL